MNTYFLQDLTTLALAEEIQSTWYEVANEHPGVFISPRAEDVVIGESEYDDESDEIVVQLRLSHVPANQANKSGQLWSHWSPDDILALWLKTAHENALHYQRVFIYKEKEVNSTLRELMGGVCFSS